ncbi:hypothetical protein U1Q18_031289 [Sarracenia purpurea var. burkii]
MGKAVSDFAIQGISFPLDRSAAEDSAGVSDVANVEEGEGVGSKGPIEGIFSELGEDDSLVGEDGVVDGASEEENVVESESTSIGGESKLEQDRGLESISEQGSAVALNPTQTSNAGPEKQDTTRPNKELLKCPLLILGGKSPAKNKTAHGLDENRR